MSHFNLVAINEINTLEKYASQLLVICACLNSFHQVECQVFKEGLFDDDEEEASKTICWEIARLQGLYKSQLEKIIERTGFDEAAAVEEFKKLALSTPD